MPAPLPFVVPRGPHVQRGLLGGYGFADRGITPSLLRRLRAWMLLRRFSTMGSVRRFCPSPKPASLRELLGAIWATSPLP